MSNTMRPRVRSVVHLVYDRETLDRKSMEDQKASKKGLWQRCKLIGRSSILSSPPTPTLGRKSRSWNGGRRIPDEAPGRVGCSSDEASKKGLILKTWQRCKSIGRSSILSSPPPPTLGRKSKSWHSGRRSSDEGTPPAGCSSDEASKKGLFLKTWERCKSSIVSSPPSPTLGRKSKSWHGGRRSSDEDPGRTPPVGCFHVYVGPERRKFVVKAEQANHPLFRVLLEEAEAEYGFSSGGPIELPCHVDLFYRVLVEMESDDRIGGKRGGCGFHQGYVGAYRVLSPSRLMSINNQF